MLYVSLGRDEYHMVAARKFLVLNQGIQEEQVRARCRKKFWTIAWGQVCFASIFAFQYFPIGASLIPFIKNNDVNRALPNSNIQAKAVSHSQSKKYFFCFLTLK